eukprot:Stramenopile-MAST_4_protein_5511
MTNPGFVLVDLVCARGVLYLDKSVMKKLGNFKMATTMPLDVKVEIFVAFFLSLFGAVGWAGTLRPAKVTDIVSDKSFDVLDNREEFMTFNHRGKALRRRAAGKKSLNSLD